MTPPEPRRIGLVLKMFPRLSETFILNEILELERAGLALQIFSLKRPSETICHENTGRVRAPVIYLPERIWREPLRVLGALAKACRRFPSGFGRTFFHVLRGRELSSMARGLRRFCQTCCLVSEMRDVAHLHAHFATDPTRLASWAQMICGISFSVTTHAKDLYQGGRLSSPGFQFKLGRARFVATNSLQSAADLETAWEGRPHPPIHTVYNGVDLEVFPLRQVEPVEPRILYVGRLIEKKGVRHLVEACGLLRARQVPFQCDIIGSGPLKGDLCKMIEDSGLAECVTVHSAMPQEKLRERYVRATAFVFPGAVAADGDRDVLPNVLKEAMAVGVPVVTTRLPATEELVSHDETGLVVPEGNVVALAEAIRRLLTDAPLRRRLTARAREVVEKRFDMRANFSVLKDLLLAQLQPARMQPDGATLKEAADCEPVS